MIPQALAIIFLAGICVHADEATRMELVMGTLLQIEAEGPDKDSAEKAVDAGFQEARRLDDFLSNYKENSEISRINREAYPESAHTTQEMVRFLSASRDLSEETSGYFEIMIEPLTRIWNLRERKLSQMPEKKSVDKARFKSSYKHLEIYKNNSTVRFLIEGAGIDAGGIGKGWALDRALEEMTARGIESATLNFGGEALFLRLGRESISISVKNPLEPDRIWKTMLLETFPSSRTAVSTSANYERFVTVEDRGKTKKLGHLINPKTGEPANGEVRSVTVVSRSAARADALSTAIFVMGLEEGRKFAESRPEDWALILFQDSEGNLQSFASGGWKNEEKP